jgi:hypothetical protein
LTPFSTGERFDKDLEAQERIDAKRLAAKKKELEPTEREKILAAFKGWLKRRGRA